MVDVASTMALCLAGGIVAAVSVVETAARPPRSQSASAPPFREVLDQYCITCHNERLRAAGLALDAADPTRPGSRPGALGAGHREAAGRLDAAAPPAAARCRQL